MSLSVDFERCRSKSYLLSIPFSFAPGENDGKATVTVARFVQERLDQATGSGDRGAFHLQLRPCYLRGDGPMLTSLIVSLWLSWAISSGRSASRNGIIGSSSKRFCHWPMIRVLLPMEKCALSGLETVWNHLESTLCANDCLSSLL